MAISLTCECGARLEIDDNFAGQAISCPDCSRPLKAPSEAQTVRRTSGLALTSILLALVGAFTVVGTVLAVVFGALALMHIKRRSDRISGSAYAVAGIVLGILFTGFSLFAYSSVELFGIGRLMVEAKWAGKLDYPEDDTVVRKYFSIKRPSKAWGVFRETQFQPFGGPFDNSLEEVLLVNVADDTHLFALPKRVIADWEREALEEFKRYTRIEFYGRQNPMDPSARYQVDSTKRPEPIDRIDTIEMTISKRLGGQERRFILRAHKKRGDVMMFLVAAGARPANFDRVEPQLREALDSFHVFDHDRRD